MESHIIIPAGYQPPLDIYDIQRAITYIKDSFQGQFSASLKLKRVSAPLFVTEQSGLNDNLNGYERPVSFDIPAIDLFVRILIGLPSPTKIRLADVLYPFTESVHIGKLLCNRPFVHFRVP